MNLYQLSICCNILRSSLCNLIIYKTDIKKAALISERRDLCLPSGADRKQCCKLELQPHTHSSSAALRGHVISIRLIIMGPGPGQGRMWMFTDHELQERVFWSRVAACSLQGG